jgi:epoxyqueuosine reductase
VERQVAIRSRAPRPDAITPDDALSDRIREEALRLGFDAVGFARAETHPHRERLLEWLSQRRHATMRWMARDPERRADPRRVLRETHTVISLAVGYYKGEAPPEAPLSGRVARYAWGRDYHKRVRKRVLNLGFSIRNLVPEVRFLAYVDTGPFLDRAWAESSGIGWIGKNTNLIRPEFGSYCFLGAVLTDLDLAPSAPARNRCGTCARCIPACPTGAIVAPYVLDANRCISYLTIEHRGAIPIELRPAIGTRIFGCDDCQEACPWNRFATPSADPAFDPRPDQQAPRLLPLLELDDEGFATRYAGTALRRADRDRFVRNVTVALGNLGDARALPALARALREDRDPVVRGHAAWALGRIGGPGAERALRGAEGSERDPETRREIGYALADCPNRKPKPRTEETT